jgi:hypothetical protein
MFSEPRVPVFRIYEVNHYFLIPTGLPTELAGTHNVYTHTHIRKKKLRALSQKYSTVHFRENNAYI